MEIYLKLSKKIKKYDLIKEPYPHILVDTDKKLHGWWAWKARECTQERLLINPYVGCSIDCIFCYAKGFRGYFQVIFDKKIVIVWKDFDKKIARQLDSIKVASCGYLSPVTEPFQIINKKYKLSEKIIYEFIKRNIPIEFITKAKIPQEAIELIKQQKHSFAQVSILTCDEDLRRKLSPGKDAASVEELFNNIKRLAKASIHTVCRIDPILPYITDNKQDLYNLIKIVKDLGANHIVSSCLDIPVRIYKYIINQISQAFGEFVRIKYYKLYKEVMQGYFHADIMYRKNLFLYLRETCDKLNIGFSLCMEFEKKDDKFLGLNRIFSTTKNCEGIDIPIYKRNGNNDRFNPASCDGACLFCKQPICGIKELALGNPHKPKAFKLEDYRRWSKFL